MSDETKYPSQMADRFQVRFPPGLRDRIKAYAESQGRSMNTEIVRVLEEHFPEPEPLDVRIRELLELLRVLEAGAAVEAVDKLADGILDTVRGIASGRIKGVPDGLRSRVSARLSDWEEREADNYNSSQTWDIDEIENYNRGEGRAKYPPDPGVDLDEENPFE